MSVKNETSIWWAGAKIPVHSRYLLVGAMEQIDNPFDAQAFKSLYVMALQNEGSGWEVACSNLGYMTGDLQFHQAKRLRRWMNVVHPLFGDPDDPLSDRELLALGDADGLRARAGLPPLPRHAQPPEPPQPPPDVPQPNRRQFLG